MDYDNRPLVAYTAYTFEQVRTFKKFHYLRECKRQSFGIGHKGSIAVMICTIFLFVVSVLSPYSDRIPTASWWLVAIVGVLVLLEVYHYRASRGLNYTQRTHKKVKAGLLASGQSYTFRDHDFDVETCIPESTSKATMSYDTLYSVGEDEGAFYLYASEQGAHIVDKHGFKTGTPDEFRNLLLSSLPAEKCKISYPTT